MRKLWRYLHLFKAIIWIKSRRKYEIYIRKVLILFARVQHALSYHLIQVPWWKLRKPDSDLLENFSNVVWRFVTNEHRDVLWRDVLWRSIGIGVCTAKLELRIWVRIDRIQIQIWRRIRMQPASTWKIWFGGVRRRNSDIREISQFYCKTEFRLRNEDWPNLNPTLETDRILITFNSKTLFFSLLLIYYRIWIRSMLID